MATPVINTEDTQTLEEYFRSSIERRLEGASIEEEDVMYETPATRLLEMRKEMQEMDQALHMQKEEFQLKTEALQNRRDDLRRRENQLKESLVKFDKFLRENEAKQMRALKKMQEEHRIREQKELEIAKLKEQMASLTAKRERQNHIMETNSMFQRYLEAVVENSAGEFGEIKDLIARFDTLKASNKDLSERAVAVLDQNESERSKLAASLEEKRSNTLALTNELARLLVKLEETQLKKQHWQLELDQILAATTGKSLLLGKIKMSLGNLFGLIKHRMDNRLQNTHDPLDQIEKLEMFTLDLTGIAEELQHAAAQEEAPLASAQLSASDLRTTAAEGKRQQRSLTKKKHAGGGQSHATLTSNEDWNSVSASTSDSRSLLGSRALPA